MMTASLKRVSTYIEGGGRRDAEIYRLRASHGFSPYMASRVRYPQAATGSF